MTANGDDESMRALRALLGALKGDWTGTEPLASAMEGCRVTGKALAALAEAGPAVDGFGWALAEHVGALSACVAILAVREQARVQHGR